MSGFLNLFKKKENLLLLLILFISAFLRLYKISDYMTFLGDEGRDALVVYKILHGEFTLLGPTASVGGFFMGPIYYYFMAPFLWLFNYNPAGPSVMVALFGMITVWLVYKVGTEFFDRKTGFFAAVLYAVSPLIVAYSRSSWNPNIMPFFSLLTLYSLYKGISKNNIFFLITAGVLLGIDLQLHYIELFLTFSILIYIIFARLHIEKGQIITKIKKIFHDYIFLFTGFLIGFAPFLAFEVRHGFPNIKSILDFVFHSGETGSNSRFLINIWDVFFRLFGRLITKFPPPEQISLPDSIINLDFYFASYKISVSYLYFFTLVLALVSTTLFLFQCFKTLKKKENFLKLSLLFLWFAIGILLFGFYKKAIYDYYLSFLFPLPFLLVGNLFSALYAKKRVKSLAIIIFSALILLNLAGMPFRYAPNRQLQQVEDISRFVAEKTGNKPFNFALITQGNSDHAYRYFFTLWENPPVAIQNIDIDPQRKSTTDQLLVVCENPDCHPLGNSLWEIAGFGRAEIAGEWNVSVVKVMKLVHYEGKE